MEEQGRQGSSSESIRVVIWTSPKYQQILRQQCCLTKYHKPRRCLRSLWTFPDLEIEIPLTSPSLLTNSLEKAGSHPSPLLKCTQGEDCWRVLHLIAKKTNESQFLVGANYLKTIKPNLSTLANSIENLFGSARFKKARRIFMAAD